MTRTTASLSCVCCRSRGSASFSSTGPLILSPLWLCGFHRFSFFFLPVYILESRFVSFFLVCCWLCPMLQRRRCFCYISSVPASLFFSLFLSSRRIKVFFLKLKKKKTKQTHKRARQQLQHCTHKEKKKKKKQQRLAHLIRKRKVVLPDKLSKKERKKKRKDKEATQSTGCALYAKQRTTLQWKERQWCPPLPLLSLSLFFILFSRRSFFLFVSALWRIVLDAALKFTKRHLSSHYANFGKEKRKKQWW